MLSTTAELVPLAMRIVLFVRKAGVRTTAVVALSAKIG